MHGSDPWRLMRWARDQVAERELTPTQGHVLLLLATYADLRTGECNPRLATIAAGVGRGERETTRALTDLKRLELIERRGRGPGRAVATRLLTRDQPRLSDSRPTARETGDDSRVAATNDSRPTTPKTRGGPRGEELPGNGHPEQSPQPPQAGETSLPARPSGNRQRDHRRYREAIGVFAAAHLPGVDSRRAVEAIEQAIEYGGCHDRDSALDFLSDHFPELAVRPERSSA
jgi:hypothetical protein